MAATQTGNNITKICDDAHSVYSIDDQEQACQQEQGDKVYVFDYVYHQMRVAGFHPFSNQTEDEEHHT